MEQVTTTQILIAILGSSLLTTIFGKVFDFFVGSRKTTAILLLSALEQLCDKIARQGYRTLMQTQRLTEMQTQYEKYGDGYAKSIVADAMTRPLKLDNAA